MEIISENGLTLERISMHDIPEARYFRLRRRLRTLGRYADIANAIEAFEQQLEGA